MIYLGYAEAVMEHIGLMCALSETRYGVFDRTLIESALARPRQAAAYDNADLPAQAATLCYGLIKNHPWVGGNKRTATHLTDHFLKLNGWEIVTAGAEVAEMVLAVEADFWDVPRVAEWLRARLNPYYATFHEEVN